MLDIKKIELIVFDFDGVLTNDKVLVDQNGIESVVLNPKVRTELSYNGFERSKLFSWNKASKETIDVFEKAISSREV